MSSPHPRLIDALPTPSARPVEMRVLALGFSRTGTMSMQTALQTLGYKCYHMVEAGRTRTFRYWLEALRAKYEGEGEGEVYGKVEFDKLLGEFSAVTDIPCIMFVDELLAAYPDAKVILTERDVDSWMRSMENTFYKLVSWKSFYYLAPLEPQNIGPYWSVLNLILSIWTNGSIHDKTHLRSTYASHYAHVRNIVPKERLLEFKPGDGYEQLCAFLGKEVPPQGEKYPCVNQPDNIIRMHRALWWYTVAKAAQRVGLWVGAGMVGVGGVWWVWGRV